MKKIFLLTLLAAVLLAGCVFPGQKSQVGLTYGTSSAENPDISVSVSATPTEVTSGRNITVYFDLTNLRTDENLTDVNLTVYDYCEFDTGGQYFKNFKPIKPNRTETWNWKWKSPNVQFERDCEIKFKVEWAGQTKILQDMVVLSDAEYYAREQAGTLQNISINSYASPSPISISLSFSDPQPWLAGEENYMYIDYSDVGGGIIDKLEEGKVNISFPDNTKVISCNYYNKIDDVYQLNTNLSFINRAAPKTTCTFNTISTNPISTGTFRLSANYKYTLDNYFTVKIKPK